MDKTSVQKMTPQGSGDPQSIYAAFLEMLREGNFTPGDRLPNERDLAQLFGTGRAMIRDVLLIAQKDGLVLRKIGSGTYLSQQAPQIVETRDAQVRLSSSTPASFHTILEARLVMEPGVAALAAEHHDAAGMRRMGETLDGIRNADTWLQFKESLYGVFLEIYRVSGNDVLLETFERIVESRRKVNYDGRRLHSRVSDFVRHQAYNEIAIIVEAIEKRDSERARNEDHDYLMRMNINMTL